MKKDDFLFFAFFKKTTRWVSLFTALIFMLSVCTPAWAREGNHGSATALKSFGSGALVGAITSIACFFSPVGGAVGSAAGDITGLVMYYTSYSDYGKTWIKIGKMEISKGQICSMIASIVATAGANLLAGALEGAAEEGVGGTIETVAENGATTAATSAATSAAPGLLSSVVSAAIQLPVNIIKAIVQFVKDLIEEGLKTALKNLLKNLVDAFVDFAVTIAEGFWETCKDIWDFVTDPVGSIKDTFNDFFSRKTSVTANPYYKYGASGEFDKALVHLGGDLGVGMIKLVVSEYVKQNLKEGITIRGKKILGPLDETIAGMIGNMVSNYVGASMNVMIMQSLGEICGWEIDNQGGFLDRTDSDPNGIVEINGSNNDNATVAEVYSKTSGGKIDPAKDYTFDREDGPVTISGQKLLEGNPELANQLQNYNKGLELYQEMAESGANTAAMGNTNRESSKTIATGELGNYGLKLGDGDKLVSDKAVDGKLVVKMDNGESMTIDLNKSSAESNGQFKLAITSRELGITAQELSNSGVTGNQTGTFKVRLNDKSVVDVTINNENSASIKSAVDKYNTAMNEYTQAFGQYGVLAMADPNRSIGVVAISKNGETRNLTIGELSSQQELVADVMQNQGVSRTGYKLTLKNGEEVSISAESLTNQVTGELRNYHIMLNSSGYSQLFNMTGGLMYNLNGKDMNTLGGRGFWGGTERVLRSGFEAVRNMGLAPVVSTATRIALLKVMDYHTHYSNDKGRIYENMWKMALANAGANVVTDAFNNLDSVQEAIYGLESGQNPFATKGSNSFGLHIAARALEEGGGALSQIAWGYYLKKNDLNSDAMNEMAHLLGTSLVSGSIDALFRQDRGLVETQENGRTTLKGSQTDPMLDSRLSLDNLGDSSVRFTKGVLGDFKNQLVEVALDSVLIPFPLRSPGTGPNAFMNQWAVQDKFAQQISSISQGASPVDADLMRISSNLSYRADTNFAESFSSAISNSFLPLDLRSYTSFGSKGITDYRVNRSLVERIDLENNPDLKAALKNYVKKLKDDAALDRKEGRINEAINNEVKALELEQSIEQGVFSSTRSTYRPSRAGVAQDQFTYGNAIISSGALGGVNKAMKEKGGSLYTLTLDEAKMRTPFIYDAINPDGTSKEDSEARFNTLIEQLSGGVTLYSPNTMLLDYTTVDQFGRLQNTYYYGGEYDGSSWQATKLDKYTQHFYGPFGHQFSVTKDSTQIRPVKIEQIPIYGEAWTEVIHEKTDDIINTGVTFNLPGNDRRELKEKSKKLLEALKLSGDEQKIALSDLGVITMNADEIKAKIESFLKENPDAVKEMTQLFRKAWHKLGYNTTKSVTARGLQSAPWNMVVMMMIMEGKNGKKVWSDLSDDEKVNLYINSTNFSRYLSDAAYVSNGAVPVGSAKRDAGGQLDSTNVKNPDQAGNDQYKELPQTIFLPGYFSKTPGQPEETIEHGPEVIGHKDLPARQVSANYSYDLSLYSTGAGSSPYSGPKYQVGAYEVNSNLAMEAGGVKKAQGVSVAEYHRFTGRSSSGVSAFSDQIATPNWSMDTEFGMEGAFKTSQAKQYYYTADKIGTEVGDKVNKDRAKGNEASVMALESVELHGIKDITGKELTFVTGDMEDPNYYGAFYKQYNESVNEPVKGDSQARQEAIEDALKVLQEHSIGSDAVLLRSDFKDKEVTHSSVKNNESYQKAAGISVAPPSFRLPPGYFDISDEDLLAFNDVGDNGNGSISDAVSPMAVTFGRLAARATVNLLNKFGGVEIKEEKMDSDEMKSLMKSASSGDIYSAEAIFEEVKKGNNEAASNVSTLAGYYLSYPEQSRKAGDVLRDTGIAGVYIKQFVEGDLEAFNTLNILGQWGNQVVTDFLNNPATVTLIKKEIKGTKLAGALNMLSLYLPAAGEALKDPNLIKSFTNEFNKGNFQEIESLCALARKDIPGASELLSNPATAISVDKQLKAGNLGAVNGLISLESYNSTARDILADPATAIYVDKQLKAGTPGGVDVLISLKNYNNGTARDLLYDSNTFTSIKEQIKAGRSELVGDLIRLANFNTYNVDMRSEFLTDTTLFNAIYNNKTTESRDFLKYCALRTALEINSLHEAPDDVRFASVANTSSEQLYRIMTLGESEIYTSSFNGLFNRMMDRLSEKRISGKEFLDSMDYNQFRTFIKMSVGFGRLNDFLKTNDSTTNQKLLERFVQGLDKEENMLSQAVVVADALSSIQDSGVLKVMQGAISREYTRANREKNQEAINVYGLLSKQLESRAFNQFVSAKDLFNKQGKNVQQYFFYDDRSSVNWDGHNSFKNFLNTYGADVAWDSEGNITSIDQSKSSGWKVEMQPSYVVIKSTNPANNIEIYANRPDRVEEGRQDIKGVFEQKDLSPQVVVHRGHSYHASRTVSEISSDARIVWLGSCGGYAELSSVLEHAPNASIISTKGTGTRYVNDPLLGMLNEEILTKGSKDSITWSNFWQRAENRLGNNENFRNYVPPHLNAGAQFIKSYRALAQH